MLAGDFLAVGREDVYPRQLFQVIRDDGGRDFRNLRNDNRLFLRLFNDNIVLPAGGCQKDEKTKDDMTPGSYQFRIFLKS
jgi:hypothetical protein